MSGREDQERFPKPGRDYDIYIEETKGDIVRNPKKEQYDMPVIKDWGKSKKSIKI